MSQVYVHLYFTALLHFTVLISFAYYFIPALAEYQL
jgi:hypothetical protein